MPLKLSDGLKNRTNTEPKPDNKPKKPSDLHRSCFYLSETVEKGIRDSGKKSLIDALDSMDEYIKNGDVRKGLGTAEFLYNSAVNELGIGNSSEDKTKSEKRKQYLAETSSLGRQRRRR